MNTCRQLVDHAMNPYLIDRNEQNCLFYAVQNQRYEIIDYLLSNGIDVNQIDKMKTNCLQLAYDLNDIRVIELLKSKGAVLPYLPTIEKKKHKKPKQTSTYQSSLTNNETSFAQDISLYTMVKINEDGIKIPLTEEEIIELKYSDPIIKSLLEDKNEFEKEINNQSEKFNKIKAKMSNWEKQATALMEELWKCKYATLFHHKINPIRQDVPDYFTIIKQPMDFMTIRKKLKYFLYTNCKEFCQDVELVFSNCFLYNGVRTIYY